MLEYWTTGSLALSPQHSITPTLHYPNIHALFLIMFEQVSHVVMVMRDLAPCQAFYSDAVGLTEIGRSEGPAGPVCLFRLGPSVLELHQDPSAPPPVADPDNPAEIPAAWMPVNHIALFAESADGVYSALKEDVPFKGPPHTTPVGHRNTQRALMGFFDPNGFNVQVSEPVDPRSHLEPRRNAKREMAGESRGKLFGGIDHISLGCSDFGASRAFYGDTLGLEEFFYSTSREEGQEVSGDFEQGAFAVGGTDIELATRPSDGGPGTVRQLGLSTSDIDRAYEVLRDRGLQPDGPPSESTPIPQVRRRAFTLRDPDDLSVQITQSIQG